MTIEAIKAGLIRDGRNATKAFLNSSVVKADDQQDYSQEALNLKFLFWEEVRAFSTLSTVVDDGDFYNNFSEVIRELWSFHQKTPFAFIWLFDGELTKDFYSDDFNDVYNESPKKN